MDIADNTRLAAIHQHTLHLLEKELRGAIVSGRGSLVVAFIQAMRVATLAQSAWGQDCVAMVDEMARQVELKLRSP